MRIALLIAAGRLEGPMHLEDLVDVVEVLERTGRMIPARDWIARRPKLAGRDMGHIQMLSLMRAL